MIGAGATLAIAGFALLAFADALGRNVPASVSPFLLIGGYSLIAVGLFWRPAPPA